MPRLIELLPRTVVFMTTLPLSEEKKLKTFNARNQSSDLPAPNRSKLQLEMTLSKIKMRASDHRLLEFGEELGKLCIVEASKNQIEYAYHVSKFGS